MIAARWPGGCTTETSGAGTRSPCWPSRASSISRPRPECARAIESAADGRALVIDMSGVTFVDSAALKELLRARTELPARDVRLVLAGVPPPVRRLLDLTRTSELFEDAPDVAAALTRLSA